MHHPSFSEIDTVENYCLLDDKKSQRSLKKPDLLRPNLIHDQIKALFSWQKNWFLATVALSFLFDKHCPITV